MFDDIKNTLDILSHYLDGSLRTFDFLTFDRAANEYVEKFATELNVTILSHIMLFLSEMDHTESNIFNLIQDINIARVDNRELHECVSQCFQMINSIRILVHEIIAKSLICRQCNRRPSNILFLPCGHVICCKTCFKVENCYSCNENITESHTIFM